VRQNPIQRTVSLFICVCIALCTIVAHNIAQNRPDSFPPYHPSVQRCKVWLTPTTTVSCSNAAKMRNPLKLAGVPQTNETISAASRLKFTILWGHSIINTCLSCEDIARKSCAMVPRWRIFGKFLHPAFSASRVQQVSDLHSKFALRPHHVWKYGRHPMCGH